VIEKEPERQRVRCGGGLINVADDIEIVNILTRSCLPFLVISDTFNTHVYTTDERPVIFIYTIYVSHIRYI